MKPKPTAEQMRGISGCMRGQKRPKPKKLITDADLLVEARSERAQLYGVLSRVCGVLGLSGNTFTEMIENLSAWCRDVSASTLPGSDLVPNTPRDIEPHDEKYGVQERPF